MLKEGNKKWMVIRIIAKETVKYEKGVKEKLGVKHDGRIEG